jgi:transcriptional regulator with PAS, ATPase and Fis domain
MMSHFDQQTTLPLDLVTHTIVGISDWAVQIRHQIRDMSRFPLGVLISGPTGTGKELIARAVHALSDRVAKPFIPIDCASAVSELFPSQMFGQTQGAFTGARVSLGCFRAADGGTLFLDEIGELEPPMQACLLRVLEEKSLVPVGAVHAIGVDVRIIAATNRDLQEEVLAGRFRRDLYHRLNMIELKTIPLKDRPEDIERLVGHFVGAFCRKYDLPETIVGGAAEHLLREYDWPGNVRELKNVVERVLLVNKGHVLTPDSLSLLSTLLAARPGPRFAPGLLPKDVASVAESCPRLGAPWLRLDDVEREHIQKTLEGTLDNQTAAAHQLGVTRRVLSRLMKKHGLDYGRSGRGQPAEDVAADSRLRIG